MVAAVAAVAVIGGDGTEQEPQFMKELPPRHERVLNVAITCGDREH